MKHLMRCLAALVVVAFTWAAAPSAMANPDGLAAWDKAFEVFSHPRCVNCHVPDDNRPRWSGPNYGRTAQFHGMNVRAKDNRVDAEGIPCGTCHQEENASFPHGPPGAPHWALAPVSMVWWEQSSASICGQIKDPDRNGGRTIAEVAEHVAKDPLVQWGWDPGPGREPAPYSAAELVTFLTDWEAAGAPCPDDS